jgi:hypothetical protein
MARVCWGWLGFGGAGFAQHGTFNGTMGEGWECRLVASPATILRMAHHRRRGPKSTRAGCLLCKPHKHQAERHRGRARSDRRWREQQAAADHDGDRDRSDPAK